MNKATVEVPIKFVGIDVDRLEAVANQMHKVAGIWNSLAIATSDLARLLSDDS